jgi:transcriptional regulator
MLDHTKTYLLEREYQIAERDLKRAQAQVEEFAMQRAYVALRMKELGYKQVEIAERLGITAVRVSQMVCKARKDRERREIADLARRAREVTVPSRIVIRDDR